MKDDVKTTEEQLPPGETHRVVAVIDSVERSAPGHRPN